MGRHFVGIGIGIVIVMVVVIAIAVHSPVIIIDDLESTTANCYYDDLRYYPNEIKSVPGKVGNGMFVAYDLKDDDWTGFYRNIIRLQGLKALRYYYKGDGAPNTIEIKLVDNKGHNFGYKINNATSMNSWTPVELAEDDFELWWRPNESEYADFTKIKQIHFAISNKEGDTTGKGFVIIDQVEGVQKSFLDRFLDWIVINPTLGAALIGLIGVIFGGIVVVFTHISKSENEAP